MQKNCLTIIVNLVAIIVLFQCKTKNRDNEVHSNVFRTNYEIEYNDLIEEGFIPIESDDSYRLMKKYNDSIEVIYLFDWVNKIPSAKYSSISFSFLNEEMLLNFFNNHHIAVEDCDPSRDLFKKFICVDRIRGSYFECWYVKDDTTGLYILKIYAQFIRNESDAQLIESVNYDLPVVVEEE